MAVDCAQPHVLADWWAEALGWEVEPQDEAFIRSMIAQGFATEADTAHHNGSLVWREGAAIGTEIDGSTRRIFFHLSMKRAFGPACATACRKTSSDKRLPPALRVRSSGTLSGGRVG